MEYDEDKDDDENKKIKPEVYLNGECISARVNFFKFIAEYI